MAELDMVRFLCAFSSLCEMIMGISIIRKIYPEFRTENKLVKTLAYILLGVFGYLYAWNSWLFYISTSFNMVASVVVAVIYGLIWRSKFLHVFFLQSFYYTNISILKLPVLTLKGMYGQENLVQVNNGPRTMEETIYVVIILLLLYLIVKKIKSVQVILRELFEKSIITCAIVAILEWLMLCLCMRTGVEKFESTHFVLDLFFIICAVLLLICVTLFVIYQKIRSENLFRHEMYQCLKSQYNEMKGLYETNSRWVHDVKHELLFIQCCLEEKNISGAQKSIGEYMNKVVQMEKKVWSGFPFLDFMLNYKLSEANKLKIQFILDIDLQHIKLAEEDLVIIIGNLLDNAIESAEKCEEKKRYIKLKMHNLNNMMMLNVENSNSEAPKLRAGILISGKKDREAHGWGISSVKHIVEKYDGEMELQYSKEFFRVEIIF